MEPDHYPLRKAGGHISHKCGLNSDTADYRYCSAEHKDKGYSGPMVIKWDVKLYVLAFGELPQKPLRHVGRIAGQPCLPINNDSVKGPIQSLN